MEFLKTNYALTTTGYTSSSGTGTAVNLFNTDLTFQFASGNQATSTSAVLLSYHFDETMTVSRIAIMGHNWKQFTVLYDGGVSTFEMSTTASTISADFSSNSETSQYFITTPVATTSVTFEILDTITPSQEKLLGYLVISDQELEFERNPSAKNYKISVDPREVIHKLSDGGVRRHRVKTKYSADIKYKHVGETFTSSLREIYDSNETYPFAPFGTSTGWDGIVFNSVWIGKFEFDRFSDNYSEAGYSGTIRLRETS